MNYFFTSDTEFNHKNIIEYSNRPFNSVEEMNDELIKRWNEVVGLNDMVFHLGDFAYGSNDQINKFKARLNGEKVFVRGNHDHYSFDPYIREIIIPGLQDEYGSPRHIVMCHYSMRSWNKSHYGSWHLFGHHHGNLEPWGLSFDVGVDTNNFYPYSLEQVKEKMSTLKPIVDFRNKND